MQMVRMQGVRLGPEHGGEQAASRIMGITHGVGFHVIVLPVFGQ